MLWSWAKRRHPDKRNTWVANKYWHSEGIRKWVFSTGKNRLKPFSDTKIVRYAGLKLDKNPYTDQDYFKFRNRCPILKGL
ncbi:MAG: hypothetical protein BA871_16190 [Desulfuromonadales bacterium C00003096]|jgi:RNA-directed DNA polymerase|nr:MAG: hypothetical protein BA871_16190 [Desulfuromonadales bacterium C00003096]